MIRNLVLIASWPTLGPSWLGIVDDQRDMDIGKAADPLVESEYVCGELETKTPSISSLRFRERTLCAKCNVSEDCAQKLGISSLCVGSMAIIIWREQDALKTI